MVVVVDAIVPWRRERAVALQAPTIMELNSLRISSFVLEFN